MDYIFTQFRLDLSHRRHNRMCVRRSPAADTFEYVTAKMCSTVPPPRFARACTPARCAASHPPRIARLCAPASRIARPRISCPVLSDGESGLNQEGLYRCSWKHMGQTKNNSVTLDGERRSHFNSYKNYNIGSRWLARATMSWRSSTRSCPPAPTPTSPLAR